MTATDPAVRRESSVIALVCTGHFFSHFYILILPPLFPLIKADLGISYTALGGLMTAFSLASGATQFVMGILVDRLGARYILIAGFASLSGCVALMGLAESYVQLLVLAFFAGLSNSVFHPADYTILGSSVRPARLGRAFGMHTFSGHVGWSVAPPALILLTSLWNWHVALTILGCVGLGVAGVMFLSRDLLEDRAVSGRQQGSRGPTGLAGSLGQMLTPPILLMFLFFVVTSAVAMSMSGFLVSVLQTLYGTPLIEANAALTGFLIGGAAGVLAGGFIADRLGRLDLIATVGFVAAAAALCLAAMVALPVAATVAVFGFAGFMLGVIAPSRDLLVRSVAPPGAVGKVFGFVSTGLDVGGVLAPLLFGYLIDQGGPAWVFLTAAALMMVALTAGLAASRFQRVAAAQPAEAPAAE